MYVQDVPQKFLSTYNNYFLQCIGILCAEDVSGYIRKESSVHRTVSIYIYCNDPDNDCMI